VLLKVITIYVCDKVLSGKHNIQLQVKYWLTNNLVQNQTITTSSNNEKFERKEAITVRYKTFKSFFSKLMVSQNLVIPSP
jgi:hypothetical protein